MAGWGNLVAGSGEAWVSTLRLGSGAPAPLKGIYSGSLAVNPASVPANTKRAVAVTIPGLAAGDIVIMVPPSTLDAALVYGGSVVTGADTLSAFLHNVTNTGVEEEQRVDISGASGGDFTLTFGGETTDPIAFNAPFTDVRDALLALPNVEPGDITVTGGPMNSAYTALTFGGAYEDVNVGIVTLDPAGLLPVTVNEEQAVTVKATGGVFTVTFDGQQTAALAFNVLAADLKTALEVLSTVGAGNVDVIGGPGDLTGSTPYSVTFINDLGATDVSEMTADGSFLTGQSGATSTLTPGVTGANEEQTLTVTAGGGTFTLAFGAALTSALDYNITANDLKSALEGLGGIGAGNVGVTGGPGDAGGTTPYVIEFKGTLAQQNVTTLVPNAALLTGTTHTATVSVTQPAVTGVNERQQVAIHASGGTFKLTFDVQQTADLDYNISQADLQAALEGLSSINAGNVTVTGGPGSPAGLSPYVVTFVGSLAQQNVDGITIDASSLTLADAAVSTLAEGVTPPAVAVTTQTSGAGAVDESSGTWSYIHFDLT